MPGGLSVFLRVLLQEVAFAGSLARHACLSARGFSVEYFPARPFSFEVRFLFLTSLEGFPGGAIRTGCPMSNISNSSKYASHSGVFKPGVFLCDYHILVGSA